MPLAEDHPLRRPPAPGLAEDEIARLLVEAWDGRRDPQDRWGLTVIVRPDRIRDVLRFLRDDPRLRFDLLLDVTAIDYLSYPDWRAERFAVVYVLKSSYLRHRVKVKCPLEEDEAEIASVHDLWRIADWLERETWDQYGIRFSGHPNLKRLLNHHEFVGHPLRKDYPVQKRQHLSVNDPMIDELSARLARRGFRILDPHDAVVEPDHQLVRGGAR